jgi:hypothetical protein
LGEALLFSLGIGEKAERLAGMRGILRLAKRRQILFLTVLLSIVTLASKGQAQSPIGGLTGIMTARMEHTQVIGFGLAALVLIAVGVLAFFGKFNWKWFFTILGSLALITGVGEYQAFIRDGNTEAITESATLLNNAGSNASLLAYGAAGLGFIALGVLAFFNKFKWSWLFAGVGGLVIIAGYDGLNGFVNDGNTAVIDDTAKVLDSAGEATSLLAYGGAALGIFALGVLAFLNRFKWSWLYSIIGGLIMIAGYNNLDLFVKENGNDATRTTGLVNMMADTQSNLEIFAYGFACLGIMAAGVLLFFGEFNKKWMVGLVGGLVVIGEYIAGKNVTVSVAPEIIIGR